MRNFSNDFSDSFVYAHLLQHIAPTAINIAIIQGTIPVLVLMGGFLFAGLRATRLQMLGVGITLAGIVVVASRGDLAVLTGLGFNVGDVWMLAAVLPPAFHPSR